MSLVHFSELMRHAEKHAYAVGYFESWNIGSLLAVADAAELTAKVGSVARRAHAAGAAAEGELAPLPGAGGEVVDDTQQRSPKRDVAESVQFVENTGIDAFAVDIGQLHCNSSA